MGAVQTEYRKKLRFPAAPAPVSEESVRRQLSVAVGAETFRHRDPIYHLTESFRQTFDRIGQIRAQGQEPDLGAMTRLYFMREETPGLTEAGGERMAGSPGQETRETDEALPDATDMSSRYAPRDPSQRLMDRFAEVAFQRGSLSAAVMRGQGKMMLFSCLNRSAGQERSRQVRERMLFQRSSSHSRISGSQGTLGITNKGFAESAVGIVVDVLKNARQALDSFTALAEGKGAGSGTLQKQYPFLTDSREQNLLAEYRGRLAQLKGPGTEEQRAVLTRAQEKVEAVIRKKAQMREDFLQKLRYLSQSAAAAESEFSSKDFLQEALRAMGEEEEPEEIEPPEDSTSTV